MLYTPRPLPRGGRPPVVDGGPTRRRLPPHLAQAIDRARWQAGLTIRQFAARAGISSGMAGYLCSGERLPSREVAARVIEVLDLGADAEEALLEVAAVRGWGGDG